MDCLVELNSTGFNIKNKVPLSTRSTRSTHATASASSDGVTMDPPCGMSLFEGWKEGVEHVSSKTAECGEDGGDTGSSVSLSNGEGDIASKMGYSTEDEKECRTSEDENDTENKRSGQSRSASPAPSYLSMESSTSMNVPLHFRRRGIPNAHRFPVAPHGSADLTYDLCMGKMERAMKMCLTCGVSCCEPYLRCHDTVQGLQRHTLPEPPGGLEMTLSGQTPPVEDALSTNTHGQTLGKAPKPLQTGLLHVSAWKASAMLLIFALPLLIYSVCTVTGPGLSNGLPELRIAVVGSTGTGKSAAGNTILGNNVFEEDLSPVSVTVQVQRGSGVVGGRIITVLDTPGLSDTLISHEAVKHELVLSNIHVFLLVIRLGSFTEGDQNAIRWIQENLGEEASQFTMVLFTGGDQLKRNIEDFMKLSSDLQGIIKSCGGGYHVFNNQEKSNFIQVSQLLNKIETMIYKQGSYYYMREKLLENKRTRQDEWRLERTLNMVERHKIEKKIRAEEAKKREESEMRIRKEEEKKREKTERWIRKEEEMKRQEVERKIREQEQRKGEMMMQAIRQQDKEELNNLTGRVVTAARDSLQSMAIKVHIAIIMALIIGALGFITIMRLEKQKRENLVMKIREEEEKKRMEAVKQVRAEEERRRCELMVDLKEEQLEENMESLKPDESWKKLLNLKDADLC